MVIVEIHTKPPWPAKEGEEGAHVSTQNGLSLQHIHTRQSSPFYFVYDTNSPELSNYKHELQSATDTLFPHLHTYNQTRALVALLYVYLQREFPISLPKTGSEMSPQPSQPYNTHTNQRRTFA